MTSEKLFLSYMIQNNIEDYRELSNKTKIEYTRLRKRVHHPETLRMFELRALDDVLHFSDEHIIWLMRGGD
jgi:hypothetical protein